jgi:predicted phage terminase large subunit-like protein
MKSSLSSELWDNLLFTRTILRNPYITHEPTEKQEAFIKLTCREALYGGAAGGGKSDALLMLALQYVEVPNYSAIIFRRTFADLSLPKALMDRAHEWLDATDARWEGVKHAWAFPSGAKLAFGYIDAEADKYRYQSSEYQTICFDELTQFTESQYRYLLSRLRRLESSHVPLRVRSATNPGGLGHKWVKQRFIVEGQVKDRVFIPAKLQDNPFLDRESYRKSLMLLDPVTRQQLLEGDWDVKHTFMFKPEWLQVVDGYPMDTPRIRVWDLAATAPKEGSDPDYTSGLLATMRNGVMFIIDVQRLQGSPQTIEAAVTNTASRDGKEVQIYIEKEPGAAGLNLIDQYRRKALLGYAVHEINPTGDKTVRAAPFSSACEAGNVKLTCGKWINAFLDELESFPTGKHDDQVDVAAYAYQVLALKEKTQNPAWVFG